MWRYDAMRSANSPAALPDDLHLHWVRTFPAPRRAWPAQLDDGDKLEFDRSYAPVVMGDRIFVPSMVSDRVTAYRIEDGVEIWRHYVDGPVRLAPAAWNGRVYIVSDDGHLYCLDAATGDRLWRFRAAPTERLVLGNNRVISMWAARGGPVIKEGTVYFAAGVWPFMGTFVYALDAMTGAEVWRNTGEAANWQRQPHGGAFSFAGIAPQGYLAATEDRLIVSGGRSTPALLDRHTGELLHLDVFGKEVGGYQVMADDEFYYNHGRKYRLLDGAAVGRGEMRNEALDQRVMDSRLMRLPDTGWRFRIDPDDIGSREHWFDPHLDDGDWREDVPIETSWQPYLDEPYHGVAWYRRQVNVPEDWTVAECQLFFGGVDEEAWIWINGVLVGEQALGPSGWDQPFAVQAGGALLAGQPNQVTVRVRNTANAGGIWKPIYLGIADETMQTMYGVPAPTFQSRLPEVEGDVFDILTARERLFVVTDQGVLYCYGPGQRDPVHHPYEPNRPSPRQDGAGQRADEILAQSGHREGYALVLGAGDGDLIEQLAVGSELHIVVLEPDPEIINALRHRFNDAGLYGSRIAILPGRLSDLEYPPYISSLIIAGHPGTSEVTPDEVRDLLRPYGGMAFLGQDTVVTREGPLPGAGQWTHQYADAARTGVSHDGRVRLPLGVLWYGSVSHDNVLPRHAAGPRPQIAGGRLVILGVETLSARDVYTGRELWVRNVPGIGHPFTNLELEERWRRGASVYMSNIPGAAYIGSPYVTLADSIYLRHRGRVQRLDPVTGVTMAEFTLYPEGAEIKPTDWGHISVWENLLISTLGPHQFDETDLGWLESWNATSSRHLLVMDRFSGERLWSRTADVGFRHNAIAVAVGRLFVIDGLSEQALALLARRGITPDTPSRIMALNATDGQPLWETDSLVFGTYLAYSEEHDILLESGSRDTRRPLPDEPHSRVTARRGVSGEILWEGRFQFPAALHGDRLIPARPGEALDIRSGDPVTTPHPLTGEAIADHYRKFYGCGPINASTHMLLFRSGAAGFTDLEHHGGTGNFGGFKSGCTASMIAADGVLNAPDYTRTCTCSYQNQTSLGLVHMPDADVWTSVWSGRGSGTVERIGVNLGAPGNRRADNGVLWIPFPGMDAPAPDIPVLIRTEDIAATPVKVIRVSASIAHNQAADPLNADPAAAWRIRCDGEGRFAQWLQYDFNDVIPLDRMQVVWTGPETTEFRIELSSDGETWTTVASEGGPPDPPALTLFPRDPQGLDDILAMVDEVTLAMADDDPDDEGEPGVFRFETVPARQVRIVFGRHSDIQRDSRGRMIRQTAEISRIRIGALPDPEAYAYFQPKPFFRRHSLEVDATAGLNWVAASGISGLAEFILHDVQGNREPYTVTLHFAETDALERGQRVFDIRIQDAVVHSGFDIVEQAGAAQRALSRTFPGIRIDDTLRLELDRLPGSAHPPILSGVEIIKE